MGGFDAPSFVAPPDVFQSVSGAAAYWNFVNVDLVLAREIAPLNFDFAHDNFVRNPLIIFADGKKIMRINMGWNVVPRLM